MPLRSPDEPMVDEIERVLFREEQILERLDQLAAVVATTRGGQYGDGDPELEETGHARRNDSRNAAGAGVRRQPAIRTPAPALGPPAKSIARRLRVYWRHGNPFHHVIHEAEGHSLLGRQEIVPVGLLFDPLDRLAGVLGEDFVEASAIFLEFAGLNLHVGDLTADFSRERVCQQSGTA